MGHQDEAEALKPGRKEETNVHNLQHRHELPRHLSSPGHPPEPDGLRGIFDQYRIRNGRLRRRLGLRLGAKAPPTEAPTPGTGDNTMDIMTQVITAADQINFDRIRVALLYAYKSL